ncbi:MAG: nuclear transport factor 2 family protein [Acidobacteriota bacterium]
MPNTIASEVRSALKAWLAAYNARDLDALMSLYDPGIIYANAHSPLIRGLDEVRPWFEKALAASGQRELLFKEETLIAGEELTLIAGKFCFRQPDGSGSAGRVTLLYRRSEGRWLLAYDTDNTPPDCVSSDFDETDA